MNIFLLINFYQQIVFFTSPIDQIKGPIYIIVQFITLKIFVISHLIFKISNIFYNLCICIQDLMIVMDLLCVHNSLLPFNFYNLFGYLLIILILGVSTVGGLGGGIEKIPILMIMLNYSQKMATIYTYPLMLGANIINYILLIHQRHPLIDQHIIDYDIALIVIPMALFGSSIGALFNIVLPDLVLILTVFFLFCYLCPKMLQKYQEQKKIDQNNSLIHSVNQKKTLFDRPYVDDQRAQQIMNELQSRIPYRKLLIIILIYVIIKVCLLIRGSSGFQSLIGIPYCSTEYWVVSILIIIIVILISVIIKYRLSIQVDEMYYLGLYNKNIDYDYRLPFFLKVCFAGFLGGFMGGMSGIGSGAIPVTILILIGVNSRVASATSGFQKLFISLFNVYEAYQDKQMSLQEVLFMMILGLISGLLITAPLYVYVIRTKKQYIVVGIQYMINGILCLSLGIYVELIHEYKYDKQYSRILYN
ncbi:hypothetical protein pb186bvf_010506 [Paramecium bursaria]